MTRSLATRLTDLLDVIQQVHGGLRRAAIGKVSARCGASPSYVQNLAMGYVFVVGTHRTFDLLGLYDLERQYAAPLEALIRYKASCARAKGAA